MKHIVEITLYLKDQKFKESKTYENDDFDLLETPQEILKKMLKQHDLTTFDSYTIDVYRD